MRVFKKVKAFSIIICLAMFSCSSYAQQLTSYVDPLIGSGGHGHVFVGASVPFGAVQVGPDNYFQGWDWCSGYHYSDSMITGFAQTHLSGTGVGDLGDILIMPYTGKIKTAIGSPKNPAAGYASKFSHSNETVKPGFYSVKLDNGVNVQLTATERVGYHRYHFTSTADAHIIINLKDAVSDESYNTHIEQVDATTFKGYRFSHGWATDQRIYFAIKLSKPVTDFKVYDDNDLKPGKSAQGKAIKGLISFKSVSDVDLKIGISPVSSDNALANINAEIPGWNFDEIVAAADKKWNDELSKFNIETKNSIDKKIFYTALYHTMIDPSLFNDHNKDYRGTDKQLHHASFNNYSIFSLWDTYRALNPLYTIFQPEKVNDFMQSFLAIYQQQKFLPIWHLDGNETYCMPGLSSVQVLAEAYLKGFRGYDSALAFEAIKNSMNRNMRGLKYDRDFKNIPCDSTHESVASALEYAVSSASAALMCKQAGRTSDYDYFNKRYHNYQLYFDSSVGFMCGKKANGEWNPNFDAAKASSPYSDDYSEGNAWQYLWLVPEDVEGLIKLLGGDDKFNTKLDSLFTVPLLPDPNAPPDIAGLIGQYAHGDEPSHATIYLYNYSGEQWKAAEKARYIMKNLYKDNTEEGMSGNDDCGQMSAWYILSSVGLYPVFPANGAYVFGSPLFDKVSVKVKGNKTFTIIADNNSDDNKYIQSVELNGKLYTKTYIMYNDIMNGGTLKFVMGNTPNKNYGASADDRPKSIY